jgi:predicted dehydrogenase
MKVGIIGFGIMGKIRKKCVENIPGWTIVSIFDPNVNAVPAELSTGSADSIVSNPEVDIVFVCTPNKYNYTLTVKALQNGKHVFCEKPPAFTSAEVIEIMQAEKTAGKKLMYGFNHRHHKSIQLMKQYIDEGKFGDIVWMRGRYGKSVDESFFDNWRANESLAGGGILLDQGIHMLDLFLYFKPDLEAHSALVTNYYWKRNIEDNVFANFHSKNGNTIASLHSTMTQWRHLFSLEIFLEEGYLTLNGLITSSGSYGQETLTIAKNRTTAPRASWSDEENITFTEDDFWQSEVEYFAEKIKVDQPIEFCSSMDAYNVMKQIENIYSLGKKFI